MGNLKKLDIRQSETRVLQDQLNSQAVTGMDSVLAAINNELTAPGRLIAQSTPSLIVTVGSGTVSNPNTSKNRVLPFINNVAVTFNGGTITFPSTSGTITVSPGTNSTISIGASQFIAVLVQVSSAGQLSLTVGNPASSLGAVIVPSGNASSLALGYIIVESNASSQIQNITNAMLYQFVGGGGSGGEGVLNQAYCFTNSVGTPINCSNPTVVGGKTQVQTTFSYTTGVNPGTTNGSLLVFLNGQKIPRYIDSTLTPDASYVEIDANTIALDQDYSAYNFPVEIYQTVSIIDTNTDNTTLISAMYNAIVGTGGNFSSIVAALTAYPNGSILVLPSYSTNENITITGTPIIEGQGYTSQIAGTVAINGSFATIKNLRFNNNLTLSSGSTGNFVRDCFINPSANILDSGTGNSKLLVVG